MTKDQVRDETAKLLSEYYDGYILIGRVAGQGKFIVSHQIKDPGTKAGIIVSLSSALEELAGEAKRN